MAKLIKKSKKKVKPKLRLKLEAGKGNIVISTSNWDGSAAKGYRMHPAFCFEKELFHIDLCKNGGEPYQGYHELSEKSIKEVAKSLLKFFNKHYRLKTVFNKEDRQKIFQICQKLVDTMKQFEYV